MSQIVFAPFRIGVPHRYLVGEESPGLQAFRCLLPPFIHIKVVQHGTPEYDDLRVHSVAFDAGENFTGNVIKYTCPALLTTEWEKPQRSSILQHLVIPSRGTPMARNLVSK